MLKYIGLLIQKKILIKGYINKIMQNYILLKANEANFVWSLFVIFGVYVVELKENITV